MKISEIDNNSKLAQTNKNASAENSIKESQNTKTKDQCINGYKYDIDTSKKGFELSYHQNEPQSRKAKCTKTFIISMLPFAFQPAFKKAFTKAFPQYAGNDKGSAILTGNINSDNVFYKQIEKLTTTDQLPDILITSDFNSLYHTNFKVNLLNTANFETLNFPLHPIYAKADFAHPSNLMGMLASDVLVMVVDKSKFEDKAFPYEWYELLNPTLRNSIVFCGDIDFSCNTVYYPFVKNFGFDAIKQLVNNTLAYIHPADMLHLIHSGNRISASVYVMPYSYARSIQNKFDYQIIWPNDGAIPIPIQMLVKKGAYEKHEDIINFLKGKTLGEEFEKNGFLATNPNASKQCPDSNLNWVGWNFIENSNMRILKKKIGEYFK